MIAGKPCLARFAIDQDIIVSTNASRLETRPKERLKERNFVNCDAPDWNLNHKYLARESVRLI